MTYHTCRVTGELAQDWVLNAVDNFSSLIGPTIIKSQEQNTSITHTTTKMEGSWPKTSIARCGYISLKRIARCGYISLKQALHRVQTEI